MIMSTAGPIAVEVKEFLHGHGTADQLYTFDTVLQWALQAAMPQGLPFDREDTMAIMMDAKVPCDPAVHDIVSKPETLAAASILCF